MRLTQRPIPNHDNKKTSKLTKEDVWGKFEGNKQLSKGMIVANSGEKCPIWKDKVPYKSVTVICDKKDFGLVQYWVSYVHGGNSISKIKNLPDNKIAIRSDYMCW